jgi:glycosyltransferase involved in cell wall biosynthesis
MVAGTPVEWIGRVDDMPGLYARATLIVYPSWYREGIPRVLLEAAASGRAIVTTDHPGCREAVNHNETGLAECPSEKCGQATADAVEAILLKNPELAPKSMEERSRQRFSRGTRIRIDTPDYEENPRSLRTLTFSIFELA